MPPASPRGGFLLSDQSPGMPGERPMLKTHNAGELRKEHVGQQVTLAGWVNRRREFGGLVFIDLRDRWGITQVVINASESPEAHRVANDVRNEYVLQIKGT